MRHLDDVLTCIANAGLTINPSKVQICASTITYLGCELHNGTVSTSDRHIKTIKDVTPQRPRKGVKSFLGMVGYFRPHIPHFAEKAFSLTDLMKKSKPDKVAWTDVEPKSL